MALQIPKSSRRGIVALLQLDDAQAAKLCDALKKIPPRLRTRDIPKRIASQVDIPPSDLREIVGVLVTLYTVRDSEELGIDAFVDSLTTAIQQSTDEIFEPFTKSVEKYKQRLTDLLSLEDSLGITSKALSVAYENPRHYHSARILTDARPVYRINAAEEPKAFVLLHTLRFDTHENGEDREWYVSLNSVDLENLKTVINRAMQKEKSLTAILKKTGATILEWEE